MANQQPTIEPHWLQVVMYIQGQLGQPMKILHNTRLLIQAVLSNQQQQFHE